MCPYNRALCWAFIAAGAAFLAAALIGSFWVSFSLGAILLCLGIFCKGPSRF